MVGPAGLAGPPCGEVPAGKGLGGRDPEGNGPGGKGPLAGKGPWGNGPLGCKGPEGNGPLGGKGLEGNGPGGKDPLGGNGPGGKGLGCGCWLFPRPPCSLHCECTFWNKKSRLRKCAKLLNQNSSFQNKSVYTVPQRM